MVALEGVPFPLVSLGDLVAFVARWLRVDKTKVVLKMPTPTLFRAEVTVPLWRKLPVLRGRLESSVEDLTMALRAQFAGSQDIEVVVL